VIQMSVKEMKHALRRAGYREVRTRGSHQIWSNGKHSISVPIVKLKPIIALKIINQCGLTNNL
jgi:predicted RNA binding protein YcfA (HicA-like mRNA interferase family)